MTPAVDADNRLSMVHSVSGMTSRVTLSFQHIERTGALEERARTQGLRLARVCARVTECHIILEGAPNDPGDRSEKYMVKIALTVPGAQIHADSLHADGARHEDIHLALGDAFKDAKRQLTKLRLDRRKKDPA